MATDVFGALVLLVGSSGAAWWMAKGARDRARRVAALEERASEILALSSEDAARRLAPLLADPTRLQVEAARATTSWPRQLPASLKDLLGAHARIATPDGRVRVGALELGPSTLRSGMIRVGREGPANAGVELVVAPGAETVYAIAPLNVDILPGAGLPSVAHLLLLAVASYEIGAGLPAASVEPAAPSGQLRLLASSAEPGGPASARGGAHPPGRSERRRSRTRLGRERHLA
jgi:hypothetical protein